MIELIAAAGHAAAPEIGSLGGMWNAIVSDFSNITEPAAFSAFIQVLLIDLVLAGDNAIVVGALAAGLPPEQRRKVIMIGVVAALVLRIIFALVVTQLMQIIGLILVGGLLCCGSPGRCGATCITAGKAPDRPKFPETSIPGSARPRASPAPCGRSPSPTSR
jgi:hypothetical protein